MSTPVVPTQSFWPTAKRGEDALRRLAGWSAVGMFVVWIGFMGLALAWNLEQRSLIRRIQTNPLSVGIDEVRDINDRIDLLNRAFWVLGAITAAIFITWIYLEYRRVQRGNQPTRFEAGWAIGAWFVPFLNWVRPYQVVEDVRKATLGPSRGRGLVIAWWTLYVGAGVLAFVANSADSDVQSLDDALHANSLYIARTAALLVAAALALFVVRTVLRGSTEELVASEVLMSDAPDASES